MKVFLCGQKAFGADTLRLLLAMKIEVLGVCSPGGERPDRLTTAAKTERLPWVPSGTFTAAEVPPFTDLIVAAHSHDFISEKARHRARYGAIGYHPSLLPLHRGRDAIRWSVKMHDRITGGSVYWLSNTVDGGPIAAQDWCYIRPGDTAADLWRRELAPLGLRLFKKVLVEIQQGKIIRVQQDEELATWEPAWDRPPMKRPDLYLIPHLTG